MTNQQKFRNRVKADPEWFTHAVLGANPWEKQLEIISSVFKHQRTAVRGCVSSSKTNAGAMAIMAWLCAFYPSRVFTMAPSYRQVETNLWSEIKNFYNKSKIKLGGIMGEGTSWKLSHNWSALGFSTKDPEMVHGIHGENDLLVIDDAHGVHISIFDEIENALAGGNTKLLLLYNPASLNGMTYDCNYSDRSSWNNIKIPFSETPNAKQGGTKITGMLNQETVDRWAHKYGEDSNFFRVKVNSDYPNQEADTLIPLDWIEKARMREAKSEGPVVLGVDVARFGDDDSVICPIRGKKVLPLESRHGNDTMATVGWAKDTRRKMDAKGIFVDVIGLGAGVVDRLKELKEPVFAVNVAEVPKGRADEKERFNSLRTQVWFLIREALNPDNPDAISLPNDLELQAELSSVKYTHDSYGRIRVEMKEDMKKRLGRSPDRADALGLALFGASGLYQPASVWRPVI